MQKSSYDVLLAKIENKYTIGTDWVVEKGKIAEAKIIKSAYAELKKLDQKVHNTLGYYRDARHERYEATKKAEKLEVENKELKESLETLKAKVLKNVNELLERI